MVYTLFSISDFSTILFFDIDLLRVSSIFAIFDFEFIKEVETNEPTSLGVSRPTGSVVDLKIQYL